MLVFLVTGREYLKTRGSPLEADDGSPMMLVLVSLLCMMVIESTNKTISSSDQSLILHSGTIHVSEVYTR